MKTFYVPDSSKPGGILLVSYAYAPSRADMVETDQIIVSSWDGNLYFSGSEPSEDEGNYHKERAEVETKYSAPWDGTNGGILTLLQMTMIASLCEVPQDPTKISDIGSQYQTELATMNTEFETIDQKYGVA